CEPLCQRAADRTLPSKRQEDTVISELASVCGSGCSDEVYRLFGVMSAVCETIQTNRCPIGHDDSGKAARSNLTIDRLCGSQKGTSITRHCRTLPRHPSPHGNLQTVAQRSEHSID